MIDDDCSSMPGVFESPDAKPGTCRWCAKGIVRAFSLGDQACANDYRRPEDPAPERHPLAYAICRSCGLLQLEETVAPEALYSNYAYRTRGSLSVARHAAALSRRFGGPRKFVVEIASNDGAILEVFQRDGANVLGVEPAENIAADAEKCGVETVVDFFDEDMGHQIGAAYEKADVILARNVLGHLPSPHSFLDGCRDLLTDDGVLIIEAPSLTEVYNHRDYSYCLPPGEKVMTSEGLRPIETIKVGDRVLTHKGRLRKVTKTMQRPYSGPMLSVRAYGHSSPVRMTPEHPVYIARHKNKRLKRGESHHFVQAKDLKKGDFWLRPRDKSSPEIATLPTLAIKKRRQHPDEIQTDEAWMRVCGFFVAEGSVGEVPKDNSTLVTFTFGKHQSEIALAWECMAILRDRGFAGSIRRSEYGWNVLTSGPAARFFRDHFGAGAKNKRIPEWLFRLPEDNILAFLTAYGQGDGYRYRKGQYIRAVTVSEDLADGISWLATRVGWASSVCKMKPAKPGKTIAGNPKPTMNPLPPIDILLKTRQQDRCKVWMGDNYEYRYIKRIDSAPYAGMVYNIEVEEDNSYCSLIGAVHNCYHEHVGLPGAWNMARLMATHGLVLVEVVPIDLHGGSTQYQVRKRGTQGASVLKMQAAESVSGALRESGWEAFAKDAIRNRERVVEGLTALRDEGLRVAGYTAPAKLSVLAQWARLTPDLLPVVFDTTPEKQGRLVPGTAIPIEDAERMPRFAPDVLFVGAHNLAVEIKKRWPKRRMFKAVPEWGEVT